MPVGNKDVTTVLNNVQDTLFTVKLGLDAMKSKEPKSRIAGIRNFIVFGRAVTNVLQNLRGLVPEFDRWYKPYQEQMVGDPLMKFFYIKRSEILKEGKLNIHSSTRLSGNPGLLLQKYPKPPRAKSFFIGDNIGGSGWEVELSNGTIEKYYVELAENIPGLELNVEIHFSDVPNDFKNLPAPSVCQKYYDYLEKMVDDAKRTFTK